MATIKKYLKPSMNVVAISDSKMLCSSDTTKYLCSEFCKLWHICRDRSEGKFCINKKEVWP